MALERMKIQKLILVIGTLVGIEINIAYICIDAMAKAKSRYVRGGQVKEEAVNALNVGEYTQ